MLSATAVRTVKLPSGEAVPVLGQGTWHLGEHKSRREEEIHALRVGLDLGMILIDTAEMYADGGAEDLVGEAIKGRRKDVFLVSKVLPDHATVKGTMTACERSLRRLKTNHLDLYLLHWRGSIPLEETLSAFGALIEAGKIRYWGISNFDISDMEELVALTGGEDIATDQILYNLSRRGPEYNLLPWCRQRHIPIMAYSPIEQGRILKNPQLEAVAVRHSATPAQVALAWVLHQEQIIAIPKAGTARHVRENRGALEVHLTEEDMVALDRAFPPPKEPRPLEML